MIKKYKIIIISIILSLAFSYTALANSYPKITDNITYATVTQIIDGDAFKVRLNDGTSAYIKLSGINAKGSDDAYNYLIQNVLGANVTLTKDNVNMSKKWNYMLVNLNGVNLNQKLVEQGFAVIDTTQNKNSMYDSLLSAQNTASGYGLGLWAYSSPSSSTVTGQTSANIYSGAKVNINTATSSQLQTMLNNINSKLATEIISYRNKNPFTTIQELKFVDGITKDIYNQNKNIITVSTNINSAYEKELQTLNLTDSEINKILDYRAKESFDKIEKIKDLVSSTTYNKIHPYISIGLTNKTEKTISDYISNINGAEKSYLLHSGVPSSVAESIIKYRRNGYTYKTLMELTKLPSINLTEKNLNYLEDNLKTKTNLNPSLKNELDSIFSSSLATKIYNKSLSDTDDLKTFLGETIYNKVKDYIYINEDNSEYINLNTASESQLTSIGFTYSQARQIINSRPINNATKLPFNIEYFNTKVSLYTNINNSTYKELMSLNNGITQSIANNILNYVKDQPFGSLSEFKAYLESISAGDLYNSIKNYIVIR